MTNFDEYMTNTNLVLQAIIRYDDGREIRGLMWEINGAVCLFKMIMNISGCYVNVS